MKVMELKEVHFSSIHDPSVEDDKLYVYTGKELKKKMTEYCYQVVDTIPASVYWKDFNGVVLGCNKYMFKMLGFNSRDKVIGKTNQDLLSPETADEIDAIDQKIIQEDIFFQREELGRSSHTSEDIVVLSSKQVARNENNELLWLAGCSFDITKQKDAEKNVYEEKQQRIAAEIKIIEEEQKTLIAQEEQHVTTLLGGSLTHDAKNRLTPPRMRLEMLAIITNKIKEQGYHSLNPRELEILFTYTNMAIQGIDEVNEELIASDQYMRDRSLGHQEAAKKHAKVQYINKSVQEVINSYGDQWGIEIHNQVRDFEFLGDKMSIYKIIGNLLSNAHRQIKEKGQGEIFITTGEYENHNLLKVKDTAGGVTQAFVDRILDLYKTREVKGTGLGLSSAQVLMKDMNGRLEVHLVEGDKIEFQLFFPKTA